MCDECGDPAVWYDGSLAYCEAHMPGKSQKRVDDEEWIAVEDFLRGIIGEEKEDNT